jgi:hypothetical protein
MIGIGLRDQDTLISYNDKLFMDARIESSAYKLINDLNPTSFYQESKNINPLIVMYLVQNQLFITQREESKLKNNVGKNQRELELLNKDIDDKSKKVFLLSSEIYKFNSKLNDGTNRSQKNKGTIKGRIRLIKEEKTELEKTIMKQKLEISNLSISLEKDNLELKRINKILDRLNKEILQLTLERKDSNYQTSSNCHSSLSTKSNTPSSNYSIGNKGDSKRTYSTSVRSLGKLSNKSFILDSPSYIEIKRILLNSPINEETQLKIEKFLLSQSLIYQQEHIKQQETNDLNYRILNPEVSKLILEAKKDLTKLLNNLKEQLLLDEKESNSLLNKLLLGVSKDQIISIVLGRFLRVLSNEGMINKNTIYTDVCMDISAGIINTFLANKYNVYKKSFNLKNPSEYINGFYEWKEEFIKSSIFDIDQVSEKFNIGNKFLNLLLECHLLEINIVKTNIKQQQTILIPAKKITKLHMDPVLFSLPSNLPMVVPPKRYVREEYNGKFKERLGGYLLNDLDVTRSLIIPN